MNKVGKVQRKMKEVKNAERENFERKTEKITFRDMFVVQFC